MIVYQTENFGNRYEYRSNPHKNYVVPPHIHEYSEIAFTKSGITTVIVDGKKHLLKENQLIFIMPNQIHEYSCETESTMRCAVFSNDHVPAFFEKIKDTYPVCPIIDLSDKTELLEVLDSASAPDTLMLCGILNLICDILTKSCEWSQRLSREHSMLYEVISFVSQNFKEDILLKDLAKKLGYHEKYLSSSLHSLLGMNFRTFLSSYRINYAKHLLKNKSSRELRISDIALQCGFSSISSFNRAFFEIAEMTPSQFRSKK